MKITRPPRDRQTATIASAFVCLLVIAPLLKASPSSSEKKKLKGDSRSSRTIAELEDLGATVSVLTHEDGGEVIHVGLFGPPSRGQWQGGDEGVQLISDLPNVTSLRIQDREAITDHGMKFVGSLGRLRSLMLFRTSVTDAGLEHLQTLGNLEHLSLTSNHFTDAGLRHLDQQTNLKSLRLDESQITDGGLRILKEQGNLETLEFLSLNRTQIGDDGLEYLRELTNLKSLYLSFTQVTDLGMAHLQSLPNLEKIILNDTSISDAGLVHLQNMENLWLLYLSRTLITDQGVRELESLRNLSYLWLGSPQITNAGLVHLKAFPNLEELDLTDTQTTDAGLIHLKALKNLKTLFLHRTKITEEGRRSLNESLTDCDIGWVKPRTLQVGDPAPEITLERMLQAPEGTKLSWKSLRGKVVVLEFWATWCGPCVVSIPHMNELAEKFKNKPVQFISITSEEQTVVEAFLRKRSLQGWIGLDTQSSMARRYEVSSIPSTVVVDQNGIIRVITHPQQLTRQTLNVLLNASTGIPGSRTRGRL